MTIRRLIELGANLDDEIAVEARTYDEEGNRKDTLYNFDGVDIGVDFDIDKILLKVDVQSAIY